MVYFYYLVLFFVQCFLCLFKMSFEIFYSGLCDINDLC